MIESQGHMRRFNRVRLLASAGAALAVSLASAAHAQSSPAPVPPIHQAIDGNGVDTVLGTFNTSSTDVSIGQSAHDGMAYTRYWNGYGGWRDSVAATLTGDSTHVTVSIGGSSESFTNGVSDNGTGSTLTYNGVYTYTTGEGVVATFTPANGTYDRYVSNLGWATSIRYPDGAQWTYTYKSLKYCPYDRNDYQGACPTARSVRLQSVTNNLGYQLKMTYKSNTLNNEDEIDDWQTVTKVTAINNAVEGCDPTADSCSLSGNWPSASYALNDTSGGSTEDVTDPLGRVKRYTYDTSGRITAFRRAGFSNDTTTVAYGNNGVSSVTVGGVTTNYSYATPSSDLQTVTVTDALNQQSVVSSAISTGLVSSVRDALSHTTYYAYDGNGRVTQISAQEGNQVQYGYDDRGNVTTTTLVAKPGSGLANIVTSASYPAGCSTGVTCNKPTSTTDGRNNVTSYTYDPTHGGITSVTSPAGANGIQPQTRYSYTSYNGIWRLTGTSTCRTTSSCVGNSDETKSTVIYTGTNLFATSTSSGSGDGSVMATNAIAYDSIGNVSAVDGPLAGSADTTNYYYDAARQPVAVLSPDPDGSGPLKRREIVYHYILDGLADSIRRATTDANGGSFQPLQTAYQGYDSNGRLIMQRSTSDPDGSIWNVTHYGYDALGRQACTVVRMNTDSWMTQTDGCTAQSTGPNGPDRITRVQYDAVGRQSVVTSAYGTADASNDAATTYTPNGLVFTQTDAMGNVTTNLYDGFDRISQRQYPSTPQGAGTSNGGDHEEFLFDANGNMTLKRLRDNRLMYFSYDALNRLTSKSVDQGCAARQVGACAPASATRPVYYGYDLSGRQTYARFDSATGGEGVGAAYDALGRMTSSTTTMGGNARTLGYAYDIQGNRTQITHPDGTYFSYSYDVLGEMVHAWWTAANVGTVPFMAITYDDLGRRTDINRASSYTGYNYDGASRLIDQDQRFNGGNGNATNHFGYSPASQITSKTRDNDDYAFTGSVNVNRGYATNGLNQYTSGGPANFTYDVNGNLVSDGSTAYLYDAENRLISASGAHTATLTYDPMGRLFQTSGGPAGVTQFLYDGSQLVGEYNGSNTLLRRYMFGPGGDEAIMWDEGSAMNCSGSHFLHTDERGSVVAIANCGGNREAVNAYDEYGIPNGSNQGRFQYTGQAWIPELGLYYYKARMYSPTMGRFLQTDPVGYADGMNWYNYIGSDPINGVDSTGLACDRVAPTGSIIARHCSSDSSGGISGGGRGSSGGGIQKVTTSTTLTLDGTPIATFSSSYYTSNLSAAGTFATNGTSDLQQNELQDGPQNGDDISVTASVNCGLHPSDPRCGGGMMAIGQNGGGSRGPGERGAAGSAQGTDNPYKKMRPHPEKPGYVIEKNHQTGKDVIKKAPPGFPWDKFRSFPFLLIPTILLDPCVSNPYASGCDPVV